MSLASHFADEIVMADDANACARELWGRQVESMLDADALAWAYVKRSEVNRLPKDKGLDAKIAWQATASALWKNSGGTRFCPSASVAASFVLTRSAIGKAVLPFAAQIIQIPKGFMPSPVLGDYEGSLLVARINDHKLLVSTYVDRPGTAEGSGTSILFMPDDYDDGDVQIQAEPRGLLSSTAKGPEPTSPEAFEASGRMLLRIIRNFASWIAAFPIERSVDRKASVAAGRVGASLSIGPMVYLKTEVIMCPEMRDSARRLTRLDASFETKKLAMRHIVRGHWKQQVVKTGHKTIFVAPYWRGPDGPQAWGRTYRLTSANSNSKAGK